MFGHTRFRSIYLQWFRYTLPVENNWVLHLTTWIWNFVHKRRIDRLHELLV